MNRRQRSIMPRVHSLQHVESLLPTHFANHDAVWTHAECVDDELPLFDSALAFNVGWSRLQTCDVLLLELELGCVFDRHDPLIVGDESRQDVRRVVFPEPFHHSDTIQACGDAVMEKTRSFSASETAARPASQT